MKKQVSWWCEMTKYELISEEIRKRIGTAYYPEDQPIPDENSLAAEFKCKENDDEACARSFSGGRSAL